MCVKAVSLEYALAVILDVHLGCSSCLRENVFQMYCSKQSAVLYNPVVTNAVVTL
jgi:hypothetical protein